MKYYITDNNMKSTQGVRDIPPFSNKTERDQWVSDNLLNGKTIDEVLSINPEVNAQILNIQDTEIEVEYDSSLVNKNYLIVKDNISEDYLFYIITNKQVFDNSNVVTLTLKLDVFVTYPEWKDKLVNFELVQGHSPFVNYFDYEFDGGRRYVSSITPVKDDDIGYSYLVYRKLKEGETGILVGNNKLPFKVYFAPMEDTQLLYTDNNSAPISAWNLLEHFHSLADGLTYKIQIVPYKFIHATGDFEGGKPLYKLNGNKSKGVISGDKSPIFEITRYEMNNEPEDIEANTYNIDLTSIKQAPHNFNILPGLEYTKLAIEGVKEIDWPFNQIDTSLDSLKVRLGSFIAPNEMENYYTFNDQVYYRTDDNTWTNTTELAMFTNQLSEYKANNPITSNGFLEFGSDITSTIRNAAYAKGVIGKGTSLVSGLVSSVGGTVIDRQNKKKAPESVKGDTNTYALLNNMQQPYKLSFVNYKYVGNDRLSIFNGLYKYGSGYEGSLFVEKYEDIKRPMFNFIRLDNLSNSQLNMELPNEVLEAMGEQLTEGVRIWNSGWLEYKADLSGNGDKI